MKNIKKKEKYAYLMDKLKAAITNEYYYEAIFIEYAVLEDRTASILRHMKCNKNIDDLTLNDKLKCIENSLVNGFSEVFMYMGIVLAVFAVLLLSNFIASSISAKTRDIGILRALGATSGDVFKIFFFESFIISVSCILLSIVGSFILSGVLNKVVCGELGVNIFVFGITSMLMLIVLALFTTIIATFIPVRNAAKKKPVESIRVS